MMRKARTQGNRGLALAARAAALACLAMLLTVPLASAQSIESGAIVGTVSDAQGDALPGVTVVLTSESLGTTAQVVTNENGGFRFPALLSSTYSVEASLESFSKALQTDIVLTVGRTLTVNITLELGSFEDTITVQGVPLIDIQDSQLATVQLPNAVLMEVPTGRSIREIVKLSPATHQADPDESSFSAYGSSDQGIQYSIDGVIVNSPEAGETEVDLGFLSIEDVTILGLGAPAEYDGFSGVIVNVTTKKGSNEYHGLADIQFSDSSWVSQNTNDEELRRGASDRTESTTHFDIGGPITKDKVWFFASAQYTQEESKADPGHTNDPTFDSPRVIGKINWVPSQDQTFSAMIEYSTHDARFQGADEGGFVAPGATFDNEQTQYTWNFNYTNMLSSNTLLDLKFGGYYQRQDEIPENGDVPARFDGFEDMLFDNWFGPFEANRERYQLTASVSHFTDDFIKGSHDFKFGVDLENTKVNTLAGYSGGKYYYTFDGEPYAYYTSTGYDTFADTDRVSGYAQDSWSVSDNIRLNLGIRFNYWRGNLHSFVNAERFDQGTLFKPDIGIAPRVGITIDLNDDKTSVLKAHYGKYYHQVIALDYSRLAPESDFSGFIWNGEEFEHDFTEARGPGQWTLDNNLEIPSMDVYALGFERALSRNVSIDVTGTFRENENFLDGVNLTGEFEPVVFTDETTGKTFNVLNQTNEGENRFLFTNVRRCKDYGQAYPELTCFEKTREYWGITASVNKRWADNWQLQGSYTYGEATGSDDNILMEFQEGRSSSLGGSDFFSNPNTQINAKGNLTIDPTHLVKVAGSAEIPWNIIVGGFFRFFTGNTYNQLIEVPEEVVDQESEIYGTRAGAFRQEDGISLDLRVQKDFNLGGDRTIGVAIDMFNVFNADTVVDSEQSVNSERAFGSPTGIVRPRRYQLGIRFRY